MVKLLKTINEEKILQEREKTHYVQIRKKVDSSNKTIKVEVNAMTSFNYLKK